MGWPPLDSLSELDKRIAEIERQVAEQQRRLERLDSQGEDTQAARTLLIQLHALLDERVAQRDRLRRDLAG
jgi:uncharacterized coiled-coil protein SlyX